MEEGLLKTFIEAGAIVSTPTCGPCLGGYMGVLAEGERCVSVSYTHLYTVANAGNISKAAKELYISQPAISKSIQKLEDGLADIELLGCL